MVFTKVVICVVAFLRQRGVQIHAYLDDWILHNRDRKKLVLDTKLTVKVLEKVGFLLNLEKSQLQPSQNLDYLGARFLLSQALVTITDSRWERLQEVLAPFFQEDLLSARKFLELLGLMASCLDVVPLSRLQMRPLQFYLLSRWNPISRDLTVIIPIESNLREYLSWWRVRENLFKGQPLQIQSTEAIITTDASLWGWGAHLGEFQARGQWTPDQRQKHINWLELKAVQLALLKFQRLILGKAVLVKSDNSTTVAYIQKQGGTRSPDLCALLWKILMWCNNKSVTLRAIHIAGKKNFLADALSRGKVVPTEWTLDQTVVNQVFQVWGSPMIDMFASQYNARLPLYCSRQMEIRAAMTDALAQNWRGLYLYAFPPQVLLPRVLHKIAREECTVVLIAPNWPRQSWFPLLLQLLIEVPLELPREKDLLFQPRSKVVHPYQENLCLTAWKLSPSVVLRRAFLSQLRTESLNAVDKVQDPHMMLSLGSTMVGVTEGLLIPLRHL
jgi:hypothetical protein